MLVNHWAEYELFVGAKITATMVAKIPSTGAMFLIVISEWFRSCVNKVLTDMYDCYVVRIEKGRNICLLAELTLQLP